MFEIKLIMFMMMIINAEEEIGKSFIKLFKKKFTTIIIRAKLVMKINL